ncbi:hypothetical protein [Kluyvera intermedia]|uniref:hypothetical protein n=1 Tax=Kluyvera intermedia TaxID=61648 RepID=UPI00111BDC29|nr:hypothetical protein [Kluyvera intermedia]
MCLNAPGTQRNPKNKLWTEKQQCYGKHLAKYFPDAATPYPGYATAAIVAPISVSATGDYPGCGYALSGLRYCRHRSPGQRHRGIPGCGCTLSGTPTAPAVARSASAPPGIIPDAAAPYPGYQPHQP